MSNSSGASLRREANLYRVLGLIASAAPAALTVSEIWEAMGEKDRPSKTNVLELCMDLMRRGNVTRSFARVVLPVGKRFGGSQSPVVYAFSLKPKGGD